MEKKDPQFPNRNTCVVKRLRGKKGKEKNSYRKYFSGQNDKTWI